MRQIETILDSHIRVDGNLLGDHICNKIFDELTVPNVAKDKAERANRWGWEKLPESFILAKLAGDQLVLPRGYAFQFKLLLREHDLAVRWIDRRTWQAGSKLQWRQEFIPRDHQPAAVAALRKHQQGIYESPTGGGKSLAVINLIHDLSPRRSIILVDKIDLLHQWKREINKWLLPEHLIGQIGGNIWDDPIGKRVTIATVQTLWSYIKKTKLPIDEILFKLFGLMVLDECHHQTAETIQNVVEKFCARYRLGCSATPDRQDDRFTIALAILGEIVHTDDEAKLRQAGILVKPTVQTVDTDFSFTYWGDHKSDEENFCQKPGCKLDGVKPHSHQNNYMDLKSALVNDENRNQLICEKILEEAPNHNCLVITDEVRHVEALYMVLGQMHNRGLPGLCVLTGRVKGADRTKLIDEIKQQEASVTIATIGKEGLDIPNIDRIFLPFPSSSTAKVQQQIGRGTRASEGKENTVIFDFRDINVPILRKQFKKRADKCYRKLGLEVIL